MKIDTQDVPSELFSDYCLTLRPATQKWLNKFNTFKFKQRRFGTGPNIYYATKRAPFRMPHMQGFGPNTPSGAQILIRQAFKKCCDCFNEQPYEGGATPPDKGPRNRSWWYAKAGPSGLWYYDYFIQQSWQKFYDNDPPDWCVVFQLDDTYLDGTDEDTQDVNYSDEPNLYAYKYEPKPNVIFYIMHTLIKPPEQYKDWKWAYLHLHENDAIVDVYSVDRDSYDLYTVTWNTAPPLISKLYSVNLSKYSGYVPFYIPKGKAIMIIPVATGAGNYIPPFYARGNFESSQSLEEPPHYPFIAP